MSRQSSKGTRREWVRSCFRVNFFGTIQEGLDGGVGSRLEAQLDWKNISLVMGEPCNAMLFKFGNCPTERKWLSRCKLMLRRDREGCRQFLK